MCGICGVYNVQSGEPVSQGLVEQMTRLISPPDRGQLTRRLCPKCDQPGASPPFCQGSAQAGQDRCHRCPNPGAIGLPASAEPQATHSSQAPSFELWGT